MGNHKTDPPILVKNRKEMVENMQDEYGYIFCQKKGCGTSNAYKFHVHHIIFRSEMPDHPNLHDKLNLIIVCQRCHNEAPDSFHNDKSQRNYLIIERNLEKLFNHKLISL